MQEKERLVMYKHYKHWLINTVFLDRKENHSPRVVEIQDKNKCLNFLVKRLVHDNVNVLKKQINKWNLSARMCKISRGMLYLLWDKENNYWNIRKMTCFNTWVKKTYNKSLKENEKRKSLRRLYIKMERNQQKRKVSGRREKNRPICKFIRNIYQIEIIR